MLYFAVAFFIIAIIAGLFGFSGVQHGATEIAKTLFFVFVVLFLLAILAGVFAPGLFGPIAIA
ncbi:MAG: DUF1328 domain-containing protein [Candidatus Babeliaceae bacterium]|nr:DUF1328 domain-containing protein [Candidatus Babeliaceae bacterium]